MNHTCNRRALLEQSTHLPSVQLAGMVWPAHSHPELCSCRLSRYQSLLTSFADKASVLCLAVVTCQWCSCHAACQ